MDILTWTGIGVVAGWLAKTIIKTSNEDMLSDLSLGVLGSLIGGIILSIFGRPGITTLNIYSITVAVLGSIILIWLGRTLRRT